MESCHLQKWRGPQDRVLSEISQTERQMLPVLVRVEAGDNLRAEE
jgi:hypothetical protein